MLQLVHQTVVDTSVVFPHRMGPPYKRALKTLMAETLQKIIQEDSEDICRFLFLSLDPEILTVFRDLCMLKHLAAREDLPTATFFSFSFSWRP